MFSQSRLCDSWSVADTPAHSGVRSRERLTPHRRSVPAFVHRGEEREQVVLRVAAGQSDVAQPERDFERMHRGVEPELVPGRSERLAQLARERVLRGDGERPRMNASSSAVALVATSSRSAGVRTAKISRIPDVRIPGS